ncbi:hypothetical protein FA13DRAFT_1727014 [Coprinellus micaceus]|uniref:Uncharacterized protein n=1 Tax=Coprinellus micaceus TaxID=71717 RepID=A0A4Y7TSX2_COPMI|nr:hypothetical protein FA13DRAFT_1727014 [Coprinellus micaceus]
MSCAPETPKKNFTRHRTRNGRLVKTAPPPLLNLSEPMSPMKSKHAPEPPRTPRRKLTRPSHLRSPRPLSVSFKKYEKPKARRSFSRTVVLFWKRLSQCKPSPNARRISYLPPGFERVEFPTHASRDSFQMDGDMSFSSAETYTLVDSSF